MRYASIRSLDISNGESIGIALFVQGCHIHCKNCFNSETWDFEGGRPWTETTESKFVELANRPYIRRISLLGGEPLADENAENILSLINKIHLSLPKKTIWLYTGYRLEDCLNNHLRNEVVSKCDIVVDGEYIDSLKDYTAHWRGSTNQRIWRNNNGTWIDVTSVM